MGALRGQVVVGDQHAQAERARMGHAGHAGDAVVHRHQHVRAVRHGQVSGMLALELFCGYIEFSHSSFSLGCECF